jgi:hypothetical protein
MFKYMVKKAKEFFKDPILYPEAYIAYFNRLPETIAVSWFRDEKFIIGTVEADDVSFMTQAHTAKEFVEMVNDGLLAAFEIPVEYYAALTAKEFRPSADEFKKLNDGSTKKSSLRFTKGMRAA